MYKKLFLVFVILVPFLGCEKKVSQESIKEPLIKSKITKTQEEDDEKVKLTKVKSLTNPKKYKLNLIFVTQVGCGACEKVKEYIQEDEIKDFIDKDFIVKEVDINFKEELPFEWMQPYATPTLYFLDDKNEEVIDTVVARLTRKQFTDKMHEALDMRDMD
jgi:thioredoxin-related protein